MPILFYHGDVAATPGALTALRHAGQSPATLLARHLAGDWGDLCPEDRQTNEDALSGGTRLLSSYRLPTGVVVWVITDAADARGRRSVTTLLLPKDY